MPFSIHCCRFRIFNSRNRRRYCQE